MKTISKKAKGFAVIIILSIIFGAVSGIVATVAVSKINHKENLIKDFYETEVAVHVSPHGLRKHMAKGDDTFILVDLRSQEEYEREHIIGAINVPAYKDPYTSAYGDVERIVNAFSKLDQSKDLIVYCYSIPCMTGRKIGKMLAEHDIYVKHLGVGWNEWRYNWTMWNHEHEWDETNVEDFIASGSEPGKIEVDEDSKACPLEGEFGC